MAFEPKKEHVSHTNKLASGAFYQDTLASHKNGLEVASSSCNPNSTVGDLSNRDCIEIKPSSSSTFTELKSFKTFQSQKSEDKIENSAEGTSKWKLDNQLQEPKIIVPADVGLKQIDGNPDEGANFNEELDTGMLHLTETGVLLRESRTHNNQSESLSLEQEEGLPNAELTKQPYADPKKNIIIEKERPTEKIHLTNKH